MKLLGPKSISTGLSYLFLLLFILLALHSICELFAFGVAYYNWTNSTSLFSDFIYVGNTIDYASTQHGDYTYFRFKYPFTDQQMLTGIFSKNSFIFHTFQNLFFCLFFALAYKIFKKLSHEKIFTESVIKDLKKFAVINLMYAPIYFFIWIFIFKANVETTMLLTSFAFLFLGIIMYFITALFKKGYQLQSENDLTI